MCAKIKILVFLIKNGPFWKLIDLMFVEQSSGNKYAFKGTYKVTKKQKHTIEKNREKLGA